MLTPFYPEGGLLLSLARATAVAGQLSLFGVLAFRTLVAPRVFPRAGETVVVHVRTQLLLLGQLSAGVAVVGLILWLVLQTADLTDATSAGQTLAAVPRVLAGTAFGHVVVLQLMALLAVVGALGRRDHPVRQRVAFGLGLVEVGLQAGHSHAISMYSGPSVLLASDLVHLWAAGAWLGGLLPLLLVVRDAPPKVGATAARWFSPLGKLCVVALAISAAFQGWVLVASLPGLLGTAYGWMALVKLALFGVLFAFAVSNRYRLAPALLGDDPSAAKRLLVRSIAVQTGFGVAMVAAAAVLSNLPPALHEQPVWPFALQPSLVTVNEDPDFKREVVLALLTIGATGLVLALALAVRRFRLIAVVITTVVTWLAVPHLDLLFVPAYPTSFFRSPTAFAAASIIHGAALYPANCATCHGAGGHGDGPVAASLPVPPADLTAGHLWAHSDGEMFWWLTHGIEAPDGGLAMPGFASKLSDDDRWALIDFVRANNAGSAKHATGAWPVPVAAPALTASCADGRTLTLADLRGHAVRLVFAGGPPPIPMDDATVSTITVGATASGCAATDPAIARAYAVVLGTPVALLTGSELFIDPNGWMRSERSGNLTPAVLAALVQEICTHPLAGSSGGYHHHAE